MEGKRTGHQRSAAGEGRVGQCVLLRNRRRQSQTDVVLRTEQSQELLHGREIQNLSLLSNLKNYSTISTAGKCSRMLSRKAVAEAERFLQNRIKGQGKYLVDKFRDYLTRKTTLEKEVKSFVINDPESQLGRSDQRQNESVCKGCYRPSKRQYISDELVVRNAKEKILRLIELKRSKDCQNAQICQHLKEKSTNKMRGKKLSTVILRNDLRQLSEEKWDKQWCNDYSLQMKRYRTRVMLQSKKSERNKLKINFD